MTTSTVMTIKMELPAATGIAVSGDALIATLADGRVISVPLRWYPRLVHATPEERNNWELIGHGEHIHWPDLDEDLSVKSLLAGWPSGESENSFRRWLEAKQAGRSVAIHEVQIGGDKRKRKAV